MKELIFFIKSKYIISVSGKLAFVKVFCKLRAIYTEKLYYWLEISRISGSVFLYLYLGMFYLKMQTLFNQYK